MNHSATKTTWWIAHNSDDVFHYGQCPENQNISTGQPNLETFDNRIEWEKRLMELLPFDKYIEFNQEQEEEDESLGDFSPDLEIGTDHFLYTDSVDHLLYGEKGFRSIENPNRRNF